MQTAKKMKVSSVLSMAVAATLSARAAHAATLNIYYDNIIDYDLSTNTVVQSYGYGSGNTNNGVSYTGPTSINIAVGDILEFGIDAVVTNNVNPDGGKLTGTITVNAGKTTKVQSIQPSYLGLSSLSMVVASTDATASILTPVTNGAPTGTFAGAPDYNSTVAINGAGGNPVLPPNNGTGTGPNWSQNTQGDISPTGPNGGDVGDHFAISGSDPIYPVPQGAAGTSVLAQFGAATATYSNATDFFDSLNYTASSAGTVILSPSVQTVETTYWVNTKQGSPSVASGYAAQEFNQPGDVVGILPALVINIGPTFGPKHSIISLTPASNGVPLGYGSSQGTLPITGHDGNYNLAQVTGLFTSTGYVEANGFNPGTDEEIYAIDVLDGGTQATPAEIAVLVNTINDGDGIVPASVGVTAAAAYADLPIVTDSSPFASQYNLFLDFNSGTSSDNFLAFDMSIDNDPNLDGFYAVSAIAVVPEPMSIGLLALGGLGLLTQRPRRRFSYRLRVHPHHNALKSSGYVGAENAPIYFFHERLEFTAGGKEK